MRIAFISLINQSIATLPAGKKFCCLLIGALLFSPSYTFAKTERTEPPSTTQETLASAALHLDIATQAITGIKTQKLVASDFQPEFQASASVVDLQPLLQLREQYFAAHADYLSAQASMKAAEQANKRVRELYQQGANSERQWQEQQMQLSINSARVASSQNRLQALNDNLLATWAAKWALG